MRLRLEVVRRNDPLGVQVQHRARTEQLRQSPKQIGKLGLHAVSVPRRHTRFSVHSRDVVLQHPYAISVGFQRVDGAVREAEHKAHGVPADACRRVNDDVCPCRPDAARRQLCAIALLGNVQRRQLVRALGVGLETRVAVGVLRVEVLGVVIYDLRVPPPPRALFGAAMHI